MRKRCSHAGMEVCYESILICASAVRWYRTKLWVTFWRYLAGEDGAGQYKRENWLLLEGKQDSSEAVLISQRVITTCIAAL